MLDLVARFLTDESGATALEYAFIASLISVAIVGGATTIGSNLSSTLRNVAAKM